MDLERPFYEVYEEECNSVFRQLQSELSKIGLKAKTEPYASLMVDHDLILLVKGDDAMSTMLIEMLEDFQCHEHGFKITPFTAQCLLKVLKSTEITQ